MGKRSTQTTKNGKYMNPTDQARKEARRKELKKNKKQRVTVRHAVLKSKDPQQIFKELDSVDDMEFDPINPSKLNEKVLREKRRKLKETLKRVMGMYEKENPDQYFELRKIESDYERRKYEKQVYYEQVQTAKKCTIDQIPLPDTKTAASISIPLPTVQPKSGILKKSGENVNKFPLPKRKPPPPPSESPPIISDTDSDSDGGTFDIPIKNKKRGIHFDETVNLEEKDTRLTMSMALEMMNSKRLEDKDVVPRSLGQNINFQGGLAGMLMRPQQQNLSMQPQHHNMQMQFRPPGSSVGLNLPPGPPPGLPPHLINRSYGGEKQQNQQKLPQKMEAGGKRPQSGPTITAKPQIKNIMGDVTRFMPTTLKVKREYKDNRGRVIKPDQNTAQIFSPNNKIVVGPTKDKVYEQFMSEMQGLL